jgi:hypothetical protein
VTAPGSSPATYPAGTTSIPVTAVADPNYAFVNWTGNIAALANPNLAGTTITVLNSDVSVQANFEMASPSCPPPITEPFDTEPDWDSETDADWGGPASWWVSGSGQVGNALWASRSSDGSSAKVKQYTVSTSTAYTLSIYMKCPSSGSGHWMETAYRLGAHTAYDFDQDPDSWTMVKKFDGDGNGNTWTQYSVVVNTAGNTTISIGFKLGKSGGSIGTVGWDELELDDGSGSCNPPTAVCGSISRPLGPDGTLTVNAAEIGGNSAPGSPACCGLDYVRIKKPADPSYVDSLSFGIGDLGANTVYVRVEQDDSAVATCTTGSLTVTNTAPTIEQGATASLIVNENSDCPLAANEVQLTATDSEGHALSWSVVGSPSTGSTSFVGGVDTGGSVAICYDPNDGQTASDSFDVEVADIAGATDTITVNVTVTPTGGCPKPVLTAALSRKHHISGPPGGANDAGDWDIDVGAGDIESRSAQLGTATPNELKIIANFDPAVGEIDLLGGSDVTTDNGVVAAVTKTGPLTLEIDVTGLGDRGDGTLSTFNTQVNLAFPGVICLGDASSTCDSTLCVRIVVGNYSNLPDARTTFIDFALIKNAGYLNQLVDSVDKARADFDCGARPTFTDFSKARNADLINQTAPACSPPIGP